MITDLHGENFFLDNFYRSSDQLIWGDRLTPVSAWDCVEVPFQLAKTLDPVERRIGERSRGPADAKAWGQTVTLRPGWDTLKFAHMLGLVHQKFARSRRLAKLLIATGDEEIIEGNTWDDRIWGCVLEDGHWVGANNLGKILLLVRATL